MSNHESADERGYVRSMLVAFVVERSRWNREGDIPSGSFFFRGKRPGKSIRLSAVSALQQAWRRIMIWSGMQVKSCWRQRYRVG